MSGLLGGLLQNTRALSAHQAGVETAGRNLANVNNPDYARQRVSLGNVGHGVTKLGIQSFGVEATGIKGLRDAILEKQLSREISTRGSLEAQSQIYQWIEDNLGEEINRAVGADETGAEGIVPAGLAKALDDFFNSVSELSTSPLDDGVRRVLLEKADVLSDRFNTVSRRLDAINDNVDAQIDAEISHAHQLMRDIADLNNRIARHEIRVPEGAVDLRDERLAAINELSEIIDFEVENIPDSAGQVRLIAQDNTGADFTLVELDRTPGTSLAYNGTDFTAGGGPSLLDVRAGSLHGYREASNNLLSSLRTDLDSMADQLITSVNGAYNPTATPGDDFFTGTNAADIAVEPTLDEVNLRTGDPTMAGDNQLLLDIEAVRDVAFSTGSGDSIDGTFNEFYHRLVTEVGEAVNGTAQKLENQQVVENFLRTQRDAISGVSMDEEVTDLMRFQRAYQASARVVSTIDSLLDTVINRLG